MSWFARGKRRVEQNPNFGSGFGDVDQFNGEPYRDPRRGPEQPVEHPAKENDDWKGIDSSSESESESSVDFSMGDESTVDKPLFDESEQSFDSLEETTQDTGLDPDGEDWKRRKASSFLADFLGTAEEPKVVPPKKKGAGSVGSSGRISLGSIDKSQGEDSRGQIKKLDEPLNLKGSSHKVSGSTTGKRQQLKQSDSFKLRSNSKELQKSDKTTTLTGLSKSQHSTLSGKGRIRQRGDVSRGERDSSQPLAESEGRTKQRDDETNDELNKSSGSWWGTLGSEAVSNTSSHSSLVDSPGTISLSPKNPPASPQTKQSGWWDSMASETQFSIGTPGGGHSVYSDSSYDLDEVASVKATKSKKDIRASKNQQGSIASLQKTSKVKDETNSSLPKGSTRSIGTKNRALSILANGAGGRGHDRDESDSSDSESMHIDELNENDKESKADSKSPAHAVEENYKEARQQHHKPRRRQSLAQELDASCFDLMQNGSSNQSGSMVDFNMSPQEAKEFQKRQKISTNDAIADNATTRQPHRPGRRQSLAQELNASCGFDFELETEKSKKASVEAFKADDSKSGSDSVDSESSSSGSESSENDNNLASKVVIREAPLLRLENCTSMTRTAIVDSKLNKRQNSKGWGWFGRNQTAAAHEQGPVKNNASLVKGNARSDEKGPPLETKESMNKINPGNEDSSSETEQSKDKDDHGNAQITSFLKKDRSKGRPSAEEEIHSSKSSGVSTGSNDSQSKDAGGAFQNLDQLGPQFGQWYGVLSSRENEEKADKEKKKKKKEKKNKRSREGSLAGLLGSARRVSRHGDEVSVGTMNLKKAAQHQHVVLSKGTFDDDEESVSKRPWEKARRRRPGRSKPSKLGVTGTIKEEEEEEDDDESDHESQQGLLASEGEQGSLSGHEANSDEDHEESLAGLHDEETNDDEDDLEGDDFTKELMASLSLIEDTMFGEEAAQETSFEEMWDEISVDVSTAKEFERKQQEKKKKKNMREIRRQKKRDATSAKRSSKRLQLFEKKEKDSSSTPKRSTSQFSTEFMEAIQKVFDDETSERSISGHSGLDLGIEIARKDRSNEQSDNDSSGDAEQAHWRDDSSCGSRKGATKRLADNSRMSTARRTSKSSRSLMSRRSKSMSRVNPAEVFENEIKRQTGTKAVSVSSLRQEMVERRGSSFDLLQKEYDQHKHHQENLRQSQHDDDGSEKTDSDDSGDSFFDKSKPMRGRLASFSTQQPSRWDVSESVTDLDDLRTVVETDSPQRTTNLFSSISDKAQNAAVGAMKHAESAAQGSLVAVRSTRDEVRVFTSSARDEVRGLASNAVQVTKQVTVNAMNNLNGELMEKEQGPFKATFDDMPLTTIGEVEDYEDENEQGLLGNSSERKWDEASVGGKSIGSRSTRFSLKAKLPSLKVKSMFPRKPRDKNGGVMLGDDDGLLG